MLQDARIYQHCMPVMSAGDGCGEVDQKIIGTDRLGNELNLKSLSEWLNKPYEMTREGSQK